MMTLEPARAATWAIPFPMGAGAHYANHFTHYGSGSLKD
jgi:hypothetical protein